MPRGCSVCGHAQRAAIDAALAAGEPFRNIAERFGTSVGSLFRHKNEHTTAFDVDVVPKREAKRGAPKRNESTDARARVEEPPKRHRTHAAEVERTLLEDRAVDLRLAGKNYRQIAAELGATPGTCFDAVERVLLRTVGAANEKAEMARAIEIARCHTLLAALWNRAMTAPIDGAPAGDEDDGIGELPSPDYLAQDRAVERITKIQDRLAKLQGLDAPAPTTSITVVNSPAFQEPMRVVFDALAAHPAAEQAVLAALRDYRAARATPKLVAG